MTGQPEGPDSTAEMISRSGEESDPRIVRAKSGRAPSPFFDAIKADTPMVRSWGAPGSSSARVGPEDEESVGPAVGLKEVSTVDSRAEDSPSAERPDRPGLGGRSVDAAGISNVAKSWLAFEWASRRINVLSRASSSGRSLDRSDSDVSDR
jgi:hypothetical protein